MTNGTRRAPRSGEGASVSWLIARGGLPLAALAGLIIVAVLTFDLLKGQLPSFGGTKSNGIGPGMTPTPSNVVVVPTKLPSTFLGSIAYVKAGNIWVQSGSSVRQLTTGGQDGMPSFSPDGNWVYYIEIRDEKGLYPDTSGVVRNYLMNVPYLMRTHPDGSAAPELLADGRFRTGRYTWFYFMREPVVSPNGKQVALVSDAPNPHLQDVVLQFFTLATKKLASAGAPDEAGLGHQDPAWRPDGLALLYVRNGRDGSRGSPVIFRYDLKTKKSTALTGPGYVQPAYSPDGRFVAVTHTDSFGSDVFVLDAQNGRELLRITSDGVSSAPVWSPAGNAIAYLRTETGIADLQLVTLTGTGPNWTAGKPTAVTELAGLDPGSRPSWFVPQDQLPTAPPSPSSTPSTRPSGSAAPSAP